MKSSGIVAIVSSIVSVVKGADLHVTVMDAVAEHSKPDEVAHMFLFLFEKG